MRPGISRRNQFAPPRWESAPEPVRGPVSGSRFLTPDPAPAARTVCLASLPHCGFRWFRDYLVFESPDLFYFDPYGVTGHQPFWRFHCGRDSTRSPGGDNGAGQEGKYGRQGFDLCEAIENQLSGVRMLTHFAVHEGLQVERVRIADLVGRD